MRFKRDHFIDKFSKFENTKNVISILRAWRIDKRNRLSTVLLYINKIMWRSWACEQRYKSHNVNAKVLRIRHRSTFKRAKKKSNQFNLQLYRFENVTQK